MGDVYAYAVPLPAEINGLTTVRNDDYIILVNGNKSQDKQKEALRHELEHVNKGHLYNDIKLVGLCENEAS